LEPPSAAMESGQQPPAVKPAPTLECPPASWPAIHPPHHAEGVELRCWTMVLYFTDKEVPPMLSRFVKVGADVFWPLRQVACHQC
jgi:hypothetical protein